jgi:glyceraldehyde 3-phosphate dehydrogenase
MAIRIAINGFGRIGRQTAKALLDKYSTGEVSPDDIVLVCVNDLTDAKTLAHLLKYDSVYGVMENKISVKEKPDDPMFDGEITIDGMGIGVFSKDDPSKLPWKKLGIDVVIESTGRFLDKDSASAHLKAGAKKVIVSAPCKGGGVETFVMGVNMDKYSPKANVISNASCTTNSIAPVMKVMQEHFGIEKALMTTTHAFTADQVLVDGPHRDLRRARSASINIIPTTTGAAIAVTKTVPELEGKFDGMSIRVPVPVGSISDKTMLLKREVTPDEVAEVFVSECEKPTWKGILTYTRDPIVSSDIIGNSHSSIVDLSLTQVVGKNLVKVCAWYDNEWGYSNRLIEQALYIGNQIK